MRLREEARRQKLIEKRKEEVKKEIILQVGRQRARYQIVVMTTGAHTALSRLSWQRHTPAPLPLLHLPWKIWFCGGVEGHAHVAPCVEWRPVVFLVVCEGGTCGYLVVNAVRWRNVTSSAGLVRAKRLGGVAAREACDCDGGASTQGAAGH